MTSSARPVLDAITDYINTRNQLAAGDAQPDEVDRQLDAIAHEFFGSWQKLQAVFDDPRR